MPRAPRRNFIKSVAAAAALPSLPVAAGVRAPARRGLILPGCHGYAGEASVRAGESIPFFISADTGFRLLIHRLGPEVDRPDSDPLIHTAGPFPAHQQPIRPGSYIDVPRTLVEKPRALTLEAWVRPWALDRLQGVITQEDKQDDRGFALGIGPQGYIGFFTGDGRLPDDATIHRSPPGLLTPGRWRHLAATWDGRIKTLWLDGEAVGSWPYAGAVDPGPHPLRIGAMGEYGATLRHLDGDLAQPAIHHRALSVDELRARHAGQGLVDPPADQLLGYWPLDEERGEVVADRSGRGRDGRIVNLGVWMIGGPSFKADVARFGAYDPAKDAARGHGLRLAADDLYDCEWKPTFVWRAPVGTPSGVYAARLKADNGVDCPEITFVVRRRRVAKAAPILVLAAMNTWRAYNAAPFGTWPGGRAPVLDTQGPPSPPGAPAYSFYRGHAAGQGALQLGWRMPCPAGDSRVRYGGPADYSHLLRAERFGLGWLERSGYDFEVAADRDLDQDPRLLDGFHCLWIQGHSEYWSLKMWSRLDQWLRGGGNLVCLSGNSVFWRVSFRALGRVMECRKVDAPGFQIPPERRGEAWHSDDRLRGGMLRECGHPGWKLTGLDSLGWNQHADPAAFGPYRVTDASHFLFQRPEATGLKAGDAFGLPATGSRTLANGHEIDVRLATLSRLLAGPPPTGAVMPPEPAGISGLATGEIAWERGGAAYDYFFREIRPEKRGADLIYWERPEGGRIFNAGSIGSGWALAFDPRFQALVRNALAHFGVVPRR